jgi:hypothetical protein
LDAKTPAAQLPRDRTSDVIDVRGVGMRYGGADGGRAGPEGHQFCGCPPASSWRSWGRPAAARPRCSKSLPACGANDQAYYDWLLQQNVIKQKLDAKEAFTNELIDDINKLDAAEVTAMEGLQGQVRHLKLRGHIIAEDEP